MKLTLNSLSKLLKIEIKNDNIGEVPYLELNNKYILTEHYITGHLEINNLETYEWQELSNENIVDVMLHQLKEKIK